MGLLGEWITTSWFRFALTLFTAGFVVIAITIMLYGHPGGGTGAFAILLLSPIMVVFTIYSCKLLYWLSLMTGIGKFARVIGVIRITFYRLFSRLIVEEAPEIEMPMWR